MNMMEKLFPEVPRYKGTWVPVYLEPMVGSGERITVAVAALAHNGEHRVIQAIRNELIDCLYGSKSDDFQDMVGWVIESLNAYIKSHRSLEDWVPPFDGVVLGNQKTGIDYDMNGLLKQAIRFSASLNTLALETEQDENREDRKTYSDQWPKRILEEVLVINKSLARYFRKKIKISESEALTAFGFLNGKCAANFGLMVPERLSTSLNTIKARLLDLETLKKSHLLMKPDSFDLIVGTPSLEDPTLPEISVKRLKETIELVNEIAAWGDVHFFRAESAKSAAEYLIKKAA